MPSSQGSSQSRDQTHGSCISCIGGQFFTTFRPKEVYTAAIRSPPCCSIAGGFSTSCSHLCRSPSIKLASSSQFSVASLFRQDSNQCKETLTPPKDNLHHDTGKQYRIEFCIIFFKINTLVQECWWGFCSPQASIVSLVTALFLLPVGRRSVIAGENAINQGFLQMAEETSWKQLLQGLKIEY